MNTYQTTKPSVSAGHAETTTKCCGWIIMQMFETFFSMGVILPHTFSRATFFASAISCEVLLSVKECISLSLHCIKNLTKEYCIQQYQFCYYFLPAYHVRLGFPHVQQAMKSIYYDKVSKQSTLNITCSTRRVTQYWHPIQKDAYI